MKSDRKTEIMSGDNGNTIKIWAHRGAVNCAPENTLDAFEWAVRLGADGVELDVHESKDHQIVVIHDERLDRTSSGKGWVKDYTLEELRQFDYSRGTEFGKERRYTIPTMREVFELLEPTGLEINIELKTNLFPYLGIERRLVKMVKEFGMSDRVSYSSFNHLSVEKIHLLDKNARVGFLYADANTRMPVFAKKMGMNALHPAFFNLFSPHFMEDCRNNGIDVNIWTIDSTDQMIACLEAGVHAMITNYPDKAREVVSAWNEGALTADDLNIGRLISDRLPEKSKVIEKGKSIIGLDSETRQQIFERLRDKYHALTEQDRYK